MREGGGGPQRTASKFREPDGGRRARTSLALGTLVLLVAAGFRLWRLAELPPGLHNDEAFHLLTAQSLGRGGRWPVYITGNNGNEPLFAYSAAVTLRLVGPVNWAGRLAAAWIGLTGVAATIRLGREMLPGRAAGWLAGLVLAGLLWSVAASRFGSQPIFASTAAAATMAALWHGFRTGRRRAYFLAGVCLGLGLDAYVAFRFFPIVPLVAGLAVLLARPGERRLVLSGGLLAGLGALLAYAPLGLFFIRHPEWFFTRFDQTFAGLETGGRPWNTLLTVAKKTLGGIVWRGDGNLRHNLPGRPGLDAVQSVLAVVGAVAVTRRWRWPTAFTLLVWVLVGLIPSAITQDAPHFFRTILVTPALAVLVGLGMDTAWRTSRRRRGLRLALATAGALSVAASAWAYFGVWARQDMYKAFDLEQIDIAALLVDAPAEATLYVTAINPDHWTVDYALGPEAGRVVTYNSLDCLVLPTPQTEPAAHIIREPGVSPVLARLRQTYPDATLTMAANPALALFVIPAGQTPALPAARPRAAVFGGFVSLIGYSLIGDDLYPGGQLTLEAIWRIGQRTAMPYKSFVHVLGPPDANGNIVYSQRDSQPCGGTYATTQWQPGNQLAHRYELTLPAEMPPGNYTLQLGWYDATTGLRAPLLADAGPHQDNAVRLQQIQVKPAVAP